MERLKSFELKEKPLDQNVSSGLEKFNIDKTSEN